MTQEGKPVYVAHVGTGFTQQLLDSLMADFKKLKTTSAPFIARDMEGVTWIEPSLSAKVKICAVYSRPVFRAHETAKILASPHDLKIKTLEELTEAKIKPEYVFKEISPFHNCYKSGKLVPAWTSNWPCGKSIHKLCQPSASSNSHCKTS